MTKNEFLDNLREALSYELPERLVRSNIRFYSDYFREQADLGKSAAEVCEELGDPRLIARTIIDAAKSGEDGIPNSGDEPDFHEEMYGDAAGNPSGDETAPRGDSGTRSMNGADQGKNIRFFGGNIGCLALILVFLIIFGIISVVFSLFGSLLSGGPVVTILLLALLGWIIYRNYNQRR